jgi:hypothetical protein
MGNSNVTNQFKELKKKGPLNNLDLSTESLGMLEFDQFDRMFSYAMDQCRVAVDGSFKDEFIDVVPISSERSPHREHAYKYMEMVNSLLSCGFMTPSAIVEDSKSPMQVRHFDILTEEQTETKTKEELEKMNDEEKKTYHENKVRRQLEKMSQYGWKNAQLLAAVYQLRVYEESRAKQSFEDFLRHYLEHGQSKKLEQAAASTQAAIPASLTFAVTILKQLLTMPVQDTLIVRSLENILQCLSRVKPGALFQNYDRTSFILDASLNDARRFLLELLKTGSPRVKELCLKVILTIAHMRKNVEDILIVIERLHHESVGAVDLRE